MLYVTALCAILAHPIHVMPERTQAEIDAQMVELRHLIDALGKLRLVDGPARRKKAEKIAAEIQHRSALVRGNIRDLIQRLEK